MLTLFSFLLTNDVGGNWEKARAKRKLLSGGGGGGLKIFQKKNVKKNPPKKYKLF